jgi:hypothetical protein
MRNKDVLKASENVLQLFGLEVSHFLEIKYF